MVMLLTVILNLVLSGILFVVIGMWTENSLFVCGAIQKNIAEGKEETHVNS